jgi:hypothetical protein
LTSGTKENYPTGTKMMLPRTQQNGTSTSTVKMNPLHSSQMWDRGISFRIRILVAAATICISSSLVVSLTVGYGQRPRRSIIVAYAAQGRKQSSTELPANEFSRTFQVDRILKTKRGTAGSNSNSYSVSLEADAVECQALARRFDLSSIASLSAELQLRPSLLNKGGVSSSSVEVEGSCQATVTQRCVRTNEDFEVNLKFPLYCIVRPVMPTTMSQDSSSLGSYQDTRNDKGESSPRKQNTGGSKNTFRIPDRNIDEMDVMELQRMLQVDMNNDDDIMMEDEAIYCLDGPLDVGELVAQFFWLKLDPYPKKPGTDPVQISITG